LQLEGGTEGSCDLRCISVVAAAFRVIGAAAAVFSVITRLELPRFYWLGTVEIVGNCNELVKQQDMS
jgi:hypothetical protein